MKPTIKPNKVKGSYTNWFTLILQPLVYKVVKLPHNISEAWSFSRPAYRNLGNQSYIYDNVSKNSLREWFHPNENLKETYKCCVNFGTYFAKTAQHYPILKSRPILKEEICVILRNQRKVGQNLYVVSFGHS